MVQKETNGPVLVDIYGTTQFIFDRAGMNNEYLVYSDIYMYEF